MASEHANRNSVNPKLDSGSDVSSNSADKQNIVSLKTAIAVQARLVAELRDEVEKLRLKTPKQDNRVKSHS